MSKWGFLFRTDLMSETPSEDLPRYPLILNPKAKSERGKRALNFVMQNATRFVIYATRSREESVELARELAEKGEPVVIAAGGDGTLNAVVEGLAGSRTILGVFPTGTMNVFAREMGIPFDQLKRAMEVIDAGEKKMVDLFTLNGAPFVQMAGVGFDAQVIEETTWQSKKRYGPLSYVMTGARLLRERPPKLTITTPDGQEHEGVFILVGNGSLYGGQFRFFGQADNADQLLDIVIFKESGYRMVLESLKGVARGGVDMQFPSDSMVYLQAATLRITADEPVPTEVDGELHDRATEINFARSDTKLEVFAPAEPLPSKWTDFLKMIRPW